MVLTGGRGGREARRGYLSTDGSGTMDRALVTQPKGLGIVAEYPADEALAIIDRIPPFLIRRRTTASAGSAGPRFTRITRGRRIFSPARAFVASARIQRGGHGSRPSRIDRIRTQAVARSRHANEEGCDLVSQTRVARVMFFPFDCTDGRLVKAH